jgi:hypothetical protein
MDEGRRDRAVDTAREGADHAPVGPGLGGVAIHPLADRGHRGLDERGRGPGCPRSDDPQDEVAEDIRSARGVDDLRVELDAVEAAIGVDEAGVGRRVRLGGGPEPVGQPSDRIAMAHPDRLLAVDPGEERIVTGDRDGGRSVLALVGRQDLAAQLMGHQLGPVADPENRDPA